MSNIITTNGSNINTANGAINTGSGTITTTGALSCGAITPNYTTLPTFANTQIGYTKFSNDTTSIIQFIPSNRTTRFITESSIFNTTEQPFDTLPIGVYIATITFSFSGGDIKNEIYTRAAGATNIVINIGTDYPEFTDNSNPYFITSGSGILKITVQNTPVFVSFSNTKNYAFVSKILMGICRIA